MERHVFEMIESSMLRYMKDGDGAHDTQHVYRVLYTALDIASSCAADADAGLNLDMDVVIAAALLHDIGRAEQHRNPEVDHAVVGATMAYDILCSIGWSPERACHGSDCVRTHRYRSGVCPESIEAKIVFDADKIDVCGAIGIARTLMHAGAVGGALYSVGSEGVILDGSDGDEPESFCREYHFKLSKVYGGFYTTKACEIAAQRERAAREFYRSLMREVSEAQSGMARLDQVLSENT
jgi:uncharacterized protein